MRKFVILAGLLAGAALFTGTPAKAWVGCECVRLVSGRVRSRRLGMHGNGRRLPCSLRLRGAERSTSITGITTRR